MDGNLETYFERLKPYLDYANEAYERMVRMRAEAAPAKKGFFSGLFGSR